MLFLVLLPLPIAVPPHHHSFSSLCASTTRQVDGNFANRGFQSTIPGGEVAHKDLIRLRGLQWLNDEVITFYAQMLNARSAAAHPKDGPKPSEDVGAEPGMTIKDSHTYNSFFYKLYDEGGFVKVQRWSRKVGFRSLISFRKFCADLSRFYHQFDTFAKQIIIIPINLGNSHWVCGAINIEKKRFEYYDSLGGPNERVYKVSFVSPRLVGTLACLGGVQTE